MSIIKHKTPALLLLEDNTLYEGYAMGKGLCVGEVIFNTAITGYQEIMTDPFTLNKSLRFPILILVMQASMLMIMNQIKSGHLE